MSLKTDSLEHTVAVRLARAYASGVSEASMAKQIPDDAEVGTLWLNVATYVIEHMRRPENNARISGQ